MIPDPEQLLALDPEELAGYILEHCKKISKIDAHS